MEASKEIRRKISEYLSKIKSAKDVFDLFKELNYPEDTVFDISAKRKKEAFEFRKDDDEKIKEIYSILSIENKTHIFLLEITTLTPSVVRSISATFDRQYLNFILIITIDYSELVFVFPNREKINGKQHKLKLTKLIINRDDIYYTDVQTISSLLYEEGTNRRQVWRQWRDAFNVERVTKNFFEDYKKIFFILKDEFLKQDINAKKAHEFTLQLLNRIMFIYFISKKEGWLNTKRFINWLWESYKKLEKYGTDGFYDTWLKQVFFKAFNNKANLITDIPHEIKREISNFPFLNGGLFTSNELDALEIIVTDELFENIFNFYEKYNFTIKEDMPLEEEVAVDPQMIGYVYESLANVAEEIYERHDLGIFYTPRVEVDFMARRVLVDYLSKQMIESPNYVLYQLVFDPPEKRANLIKSFEKEFWYKLEEVLDNLSAVDPACGSGAFLVGLLNILTELYRITFQQLNRKSTDFELKKRIIQYSLYGVDIMPWAIHAAELRLWLQLMVETELKKEELRQYPLLPNLDLNLRIGDSLVQEVGGLFFNLRTSDLEPNLKKKLSNLKDEKRNYFDNAPRAKFKSPSEIKEEETRLFEEIIDDRLNFIEKEINNLKNEKKKAKSQKDLYGKIIFDEKKVQSLESQIEVKNNNIQKLSEIKKVLEIPGKKPFVWDIDFAEIFGDKNGFDIVIGNPPYVKHQKIIPPNKLKSEISPEDKRKYKENLIKSVQIQFPVIKRFDKKNDYYIYFYFHGLSLLNDKGTFCFITSNSWLDVGYGRDLQEFLIKYVPIIAIYDNPKRTFEHAEINTIIALLGAPSFKKEKILAGLKVKQKRLWTMLEYPAKFIMFKKSLVKVINSKNLVELEKIKINNSGDFAQIVNNIVNTEEYRVFPILQGDLLEDGWEYPEGYDKSNGSFKVGKYENAYWGAKFLRAPQIFYILLFKAKGLLINLKQVASIETYLNTGGADDFFFIKGEEKDKFLMINIDGKKFSIEKEFCKSLIDSPRELNAIKVDENILKSKILNIDCKIKKELLEKKCVWNYLKWGEQKKYNKKSGRKNKKIWWCLPKQAYSGEKIIIPCRIDRKFAIFWNPERLISHRYYRIQAKKVKDIDLLISLNSTITFLSMELFRNPTLGGGVLDIGKPSLKNIYIFNPNYIDFRNEDLLKREINSIFKELGIKISKPIREQEPKPLSDRAELDGIIFDKIGLTNEERNEFYWALCELVKNRIRKSKTFKSE